MKHCTASIIESTSVETAVRLESNIVDSQIATAIANRTSVPIAAVSVAECQVFDCDSHVANDIENSVNLARVDNGCIDTRPDDVDIGRDIKVTSIVKVFIRAIETQSVSASKQFNGSAAHRIHNIERFANARYRERWCDLVDKVVCSDD